MRPRAMLIGVLIFAVCMGLLLVIYPWATYYGNTNFNWWTILISYLIVACLLGIISGAIDTFLRNSAQSSIVVGVICGVIVLALGVLLALLFGPGGFDVPGTVVRGIFFSEWQFVNFIGYVALPISVIVFLLEWLVRGQSQQ